MRICFVVAVGCLVPINGVFRTSAADDATYQKQISPILQARCAKCHGADTQEAGVNFAAVEADHEAARQRKLWRRAVDRIEAGEMPPADETPLTTEERDRLLGWMKRTMEVVDCNDPANRDPGPTLLRRLSLVEYNRTIRDLMGFEYDAAAIGMSEELGAGNTFGNLAAALDISPVLMDKYFAAADQILDRFLGTELSSTVDGRIQEQARVSREQVFGLKPGAWRKPDYEVAPSPDVAPHEAARALIAPFVRRAYRGQATAADVDRALVIFDRATSQGKSYGDYIRLMSDMMVLAFQTDTTRVVTVAVGSDESLFPGVVTVGYERHCHTLEHQGNAFRPEDADPIAREACRQIHAWYTQLFAETVRKMKELDEGGSVRQLRARDRIRQERISRARWRSRRSRRLEAVCDDVGRWHVVEQTASGRGHAVAVTGFRRITAGAAEREAAGFEPEYAATVRVWKRSLRRVRRRRLHRLELARPDPAFDRRH